MSFHYFRFFWTVILISVYQQVNKFWTLVYEFWFEQQLKNCSWTDYLVLVNRSTGIAARQLRSYAQEPVDVTVVDKSSVMANPKKKMVSVSTQIPLGRVDFACQVSPMEEKEAHIPSDQESVDENEMVDAGIEKLKTVPFSPTEELATTSGQDEPECHTSAWAIRTSPRRRRCQILYENFSPDEEHECLRTSEIRTELEGPEQNLSATNGSTNELSVYQRDIFRPPTLLKMLFRRMKRYFREKNFNFSKFKNFPIFCKTSI